MRAAGHRSVTLILAVVVIATFGCRGAKPFGSSVEVVQTSDSEFPAIEAPAQRLATAKPGSESSFTSLGTRRSDLASRSLQRTRSTSEGPEKTEFSLADRRPTKPEEAKPVKPTTVDNPVVVKVDNPEDAEAVEAFLKDLPIDQRHKATQLFNAISGMRKDQALKSPPQGKTAGVPGKPRTDSKESNSATRSPELAAKPPKKQTPPKTADKPATPAKKAEPETAVAHSDSAAKDDEPKVKAIPETSEDQPSTVEPAVASTDQDSSPMVAQTSLDSTDPPTAEGETSPPQPADSSITLENATDEQLFAALIDRLSTPTVGESEADRNARLVTERALILLSGNPDAAVTAIEGMSNQEQEFLRHHFLGFWMLIDPNGHPVFSRRYTAAAPMFREATKFAAAATDTLEIRALNFCTEIESYGQIKAFPGNRFDAGQQVILYCEVENFTVAEVEAGFETKLQGSYEIFDADNNKVVSQLLPADQQVSSNFLRDYFIAYQMHLPKQLAPGTYRLQLTMEDVGGKKYGQASIPLEIVR